MGKPLTNLQKGHWWNRPNSRFQKTGIITITSEGVNVKDGHDAVHLDRRPFL